MKTPTPPRSFPLNQNTTIRVLLVAAASLLAPRLPASAQTSIPVPNFSFETYSQYYSGSTYTNQQLDTPDGYSPFPTTEIYDGWLSPAGNRQLFSVSTAGDSGSYDGADAVYDNYSSTFIESLNPVATIDNNATYTLTFALCSAGYPYQDATIALLATSQASDPTEYAYNSPGGTYYNPPDTDGAPATLLSPYPLITTLAVLGSTDVPANTLYNQPANTFVDYSATFDTLNGDNAAYVGDNLTLYLSDGDSQEFDNVRLTEIAPVPEPATWMTLLGGMGVLAFWQKNRRFRR